MKLDSLVFPEKGKQSKKERSFPCQFSSLVELSYDSGDNLDLEAWSSSHPNFLLAVNIGHNIRTSRLVKIKHNENQGTTHKTIFYHRWLKMHKAIIHV